MKKYFIVVSALVFGLALASGVWAGGNTVNSTAQSVMFYTTMPTSFIMTDTQVYEYQPDVAATFFTNTYNGVVTVEVVGQAHGTTAPAAPTAPLPIDQFLSGSINGNKCVFFAGGALSAIGNTMYTQNLNVDVAYQACIYPNNKPPVCTTKYDTYKFTYNYTITPNVSSVDPLTAWVLTQDIPGGPVTATLSGTIAAETTVKKSRGNDPWTFKTAFNLPNAIDPITGQFLGLQNIVATLTDADGNLLESGALSNTVQKGVDFYYFQNAGYNGPFSQLVDNAWVSNIENGQASANDGTTKDDFAGNNSTLGDLATLNPVNYTINGPGDYTLTITGTLQGVAGVLPLQFSVTEAITYQTVGDACPAINVTP